jgi:hypothetical protein
VTIKDPETGEESKEWHCGCSTSPCAGNSCRNMINQLRFGEDDKSCPGGKGISWYSNEVSVAFQKLKDYILKGTRSEVLKRLNYSREKMDENSVKIKITPDKTLSLFSCYQVQNKLFPTIITGNVVIGNKKITGYCYGEKISTYLKIEDLLLDNWFSCEKQVKEK